MKNLYEALTGPSWPCSAGQFLLGLGLLLGAIVATMAVVA